jgi:hypothetical protein
MSTISHSPTDRAARALLFSEAAARASRDWYDDNGAWIGGKPVADSRERYWLCLALYAVGENQRADAIILATDTENSREYRGKPTHFNIFWTNIAVALLAAYEDKISAPARARLEFAAREALNFLPGDRQPDYQYHGYNDNMPSKATMGMILAGERFGDADAVAHGLYNLRNLRAQLTRRGIHSEFNSPTYSPATIHAISKIAEYARNEEARELALGIETRLWIDLAARFHPEMGIVSGPWSRAYTIDTLAHFSSLSAQLWFLLGDVVHPSPMELFNPKTDLVLHHDGDIPFNISGACLASTGHYHVPEKAFEFFARRSYPFRATATAEVGDGGPDFPARPLRIETYLEKDFTVGTASGPWLGGEQGASYVVTYKQRPEVRSAHDYGTIFTKLVINDDAPGKADGPASTRADGTPYFPVVEQNNLTSYSNHHTLQKDATVLYASHPHLTLGGQPDAPATGGKPLSRLSELVIFSAHFARADEILVGGEPRKEWSGTVPRGQWIACRRGRLLIAVRPMVHTAGLGEPVITLESEPSYEVIRTTFYQGAPRVFQRAGLRGMFGGFVAEHASIDDYGSLREFADEVARGKFTDFVFTTRRLRYRRPEMKRHPALELEMSWSPGSVTPRHAIINGLPPAETRVAIDGVSERDLPFLNQPWVSAPGYFPWEEMKVAYSDLTGFIGDRES